MEEEEEEEERERGRGGESTDQHEAFPALQLFSPPQAHPPPRAPHLLPSSLQRYLNPPQPPHPRRYCTVVVNSETGSAMENGCRLLTHCPPSSGGWTLQWADGTRQRGSSRLPASTLLAAFSTVLAVVRSECSLATGTGRVGGMGLETCIKKKEEEGVVMK